MIKAIILDLGGVFFTDGVRVATERLEREHGYDAKKIWNLLKSPQSYELRAGKITPDEFWEQVQLPANYDINLIKQVWFEGYIPTAGMREFILELRKQYPVFAFSGNVKDRADYLESKYHFKELFDDIVFSFEEGYNKSQNEFFEVLIRRIKFKPVECIYVDDMEKYLSVGKQLGFNCILFKSVEQLKEELKRLL